MLVSHCLAEISMVISLSLIMEHWLCKETEGCNTIESAESVERMKGKWPRCYGTNETKMN